MWSAVRQQSLGLNGQAEDEKLFHTPQELICPITHELYKDPVINAAGQVYERAAIEMHLRTRRTDPLTNVELASCNLIPVVNIKGRCIAFREQTAQACVQKAASVRSRSDAVRFLRRAAEMVQGPGVNVKVPGLSSEVVEFLHMHPSNAYDFMALQLFADGLRAAGYTDQATNVYLKLVEFGEDREQQAKALRQCLACFGHAGQSGPADPSAIPRLALFIETQQAFTAGQVVEMMQEAEESELFILQLCEYLLSRHCAGFSPAEEPAPCNSSPLPPGSTQQPASPSHPQPAIQAKFRDLQLRYTQLRFKLVQQELDKLNKQVAAQAVDTSSKSGRPEASEQQQQVMVLDAEALQGSTQANGAAAEGMGQKHQQPLQRLRRLVTRKRRLFASGLFAAASLIPAFNLPVRALQAGSMLLLVHTTAENSKQ